MTKVTIKEVTSKPFKSSDGGDIDWYWTKAFRVSDKVTFQFGGKVDYSDDIDSTLELEIEKREKADGGFSYRDATLTT